MSALPLPGQLSSKYDAHHCPPSVWIRSPVSLFSPTEVCKKEPKTFWLQPGPRGLGPAHHGYHGYQSSCYLTASSQLPYKGCQRDSVEDRARTEQNGGL